MSQAAKQMIVTIVLGVLLAAAAGYALLVSQQNDQLNKQKQSLQQQIDEYQGREKTQIIENKNLSEKLAKLEKEKSDLTSKIDSIGGNIEDVGKKITDLTKERDDLKTRYASMQKERDDLAKTLAEKSAAMAELATKNAQTAKAPKPSDDEGVIQDDQDSAAHVKADDETYWAEILKSKAALKVDLDKLKETLSQSALEISDLKKQNADLQLEISKLNNDKEGIAREIKYGNDLAKNLSIELARAQSDKQFMADRMEKILEENTNLHEQLKKLSSTKVALEKNIVKLQDDKKKVEMRLLETEGMIQSRVDQIYQLKDSLESDFKPSRKNPRTGEVELSPIVVSNGSTQAKTLAEVQAPAAGYKGNVVSVNDENNFVIVNLGEDAGIKTGDKLNVYRGVDYIAGLEVIQTRKDICAADIKNKMLKIQVGDSVR